MTLDNNDTPRIYKYTFLLSDLNFVEVHVHSSSRKRHPVNVHFKSISYSHVNFPFSSLKGHQMDAHFKSGQDVDVYWIFVPKMDVHRTFCAIWVIIYNELDFFLPCLMSKKNYEYDACIQKKLLFASFFFLLRNLQ